LANIATVNDETWMLSGSESQTTTLAMVKSLLCIYTSILCSVLYFYFMWLFLFQECTC